MFSKIRNSVKNFTRVMKMIIGKSDLNKGIEFEESEEYEKAVKFYTEKIEEENDEYIKSFFLMRKGMSLMNLDRVEEALSTLNYANNLAQESEDNFLISNTNLIIGDLLRRSGDFEKALDHYEKTLNISKDEETLGAAYLGMGIINKDRELYDKAEQQMEKAVELLGEASDIEKRDALINMKDLYKKSEETEKLEKVSKKLENLKGSD